ncbi:MAG: KamA family radical SAM protein [Candidatus Cloacimonadia bacterium]
MQWRNELKYNIQSIEELQKYTRLSAKEKEKLQKVIDKHPMSITRYYLSLIDWSNPNDPIRKMAIPSVEELNLMGSYDPSDERANTKMPGLQHKYVPTALILATNRCPMYCRYCFRKRLVGLSTKEIMLRFSNAVKYVDSHKEINNVLISGGDPLMLSTRLIAGFLEKLATIEHLDFIRFGTRVPVTFPQRILSDESLIDLFREYTQSGKKRTYIVTQFNHPKEFTKSFIDAINALTKAGLVVSNQMTLLKGVNDDPNIIADAHKKLTQIGVNPYYVFQCRPVKRVKHSFQVPLYRGMKIVNEASKLLNGHSKRFRYVMSHRTGKIEILGIIDDKIYLKYHEAKNPKDIGRLFARPINKKAGWLDELN